MNITTLLSILGIFLTVLGSVFAFAKSVGRLTNRIDNLETHLDRSNKELDKTENITYENGRQIAGIMATLNQIIERLDRIENKLDTKGG